MDELNSSLDHSYKNTSKLTHIRYKIHKLTEPKLTSLPEKPHCAPPHDGTRQTTTPRGPRLLGARVKQAHITPSLFRRVIQLPCQVGPIVTIY
jgi:hypothetical protein